MGRHRFLSVLLFLPLLPVGCVIEHEIEIRIELADSSITPETITLRIYDGGCPPDADAVVFDTDAGLGIVHQQIHSPGEAEPVGELPEGDFCIAVLARSASCMPLAYGQSLVTIGRDDRAIVTLTALTWSQPDVCSSTVECSSGRCSGTPIVPACETSCTGGDECCGTECVDLSSNSSHCGECGHACAGQLACVDGLCWPSSPARTVRVEATDLSGVPPSGRTNLRAGIAWLEYCNTGSIVGRSLWRSHGLASPLDPSDSLATTLDLTLTTPPTGCDFGHLAIFREVDGDGTFDRAEHDSPEELGISRLAVVHSSSDMGRSSAFPEGRRMGTWLYDVSLTGEGASFTPSAAVDTPPAPPVLMIDACLAAADTMSTDPVCLMGQIGPYSSGL